MRPDIIPYIPDLVKSFQNSIQTSLSPEQISQLACLGSQLEPKNIILTSFPQGLFKQDRIYDPSFKKEVFIWNVNAEELRKYTDLFNKGEWPSPVSAIGSNQPPAPSTEPTSQTEALFCE